MLATCLTALVLTTVVTSAWLTVQRISVHQRGDAEDNVDALAGRSGCHACDCSADRSAPAESPKETTDAS
jgi:hypothetical protein